MDISFSDRVRQLYGERSERQFAQYVGIGQSTFRYMLEKGNPAISHVIQIAEKTGVSLEWLLTGEGKKLPVASPDLSATDSPIVQIEDEVPIMGSAAASVAGAIAILSEPIDWVKRPTGIARAKDVYGLYVRGSSMEPRYLPGELVFVHPHKPVRQGDCCIIQTAENGEHVSWLKEFVRQDKDRLIVRQYNPAAEIKHSVSVVKAIHKVLTMTELLGL